MHIVRSFLNWGFTKRNPQKKPEMEDRSQSDLDLKRKSIIRSIIRKGQINVEDKYKKLLLEEFNEVLKEEYSGKVKPLQVDEDPSVDLQDIQGLINTLIKKGFDQKVIYFIKQEINKYDIVKNFKVSLFQILQNMSKNKFIGLKNQDFSQKDYDIFHILFLMAWKKAQETKISSQLWEYQVKKIVPSSQKSSFQAPKKSRFIDESEIEEKGSEIQQKEYFPQRQANKQVLKIQYQHLSKLEILDRNKIQIQQKKSHTQIVKSYSKKIDQIDQISKSIKITFSNYSEIFNLPTTNSVKYITLNNPNKNKNEILTKQSIKLMVQANLPSVEFIDISNNKIQDEGVKILCSKKFEQLKQIYLNNNRITVVGVSHIVNNNNWPDVDYKLDTVKISEIQSDGYVFNVGETIRTMKNLINSSIDQISNLIDKYSDYNKSILFKAFELFMRVPIEGNPQQIKKQSNYLEQKFIQSSKKNPISLQTTILCLKNMLSEGVNVILSQKNTLKSQLTAKILLCGFEDQRIKIKHKIKQKHWDFDDFRDDNQRLLQFKDFYVNYLAKQYKADIKDIIVHKVTKGSTQVWASVSHKNFLLQNKDFPGAEHISVVPFFQQLHLSPRDFDSKGNFVFPQKVNSDVQYRGGIAYFQPVHSTRFGVNVIGLYDNRNDDWLSMAGIRGQWSVGFHGIKSPNALIVSNNQRLTVMQSIMRGRQNGQMMKAGQAQAYQNTFSINRPGELVGQGIYISPYFSTCLQGYTLSVAVNNHRYRVVLQCRFKPESLKCTGKADYWVINNSKNIRPYGVLLFTEQQFNKIYQTRNSLYKMKCQWNILKEKYESFRQKHHLPLN